mgnify:CR=1 FL=1
MKTDNNKPEKDNQRTYSREKLLDTWEVYLLIPSEGSRKIAVKDVTASGLAFYAIPGRGYNTGDTLDVYFHISNTVRLPLHVRVVHSYDDPQGNRIGCEIIDMDTAFYRAYESFIIFLHALDDIY